MGAIGRTRHGASVNTFGKIIAPSQKQNLYSSVKCISVDYYVQIAIGLPLRMIYGENIALIPMKSTLILNT